MLQRYGNNKHTQKQPPALKKPTPCVPPPTNFKNFKKLTDYSAKDAPWDTNRAYTSQVTDIYTGTGDPKFDRLATRLEGCSEFLTFNWHDDKATGETALKLKSTQFCRVRHCPVCTWRRSLMWKARFYEALPKLQKEHPTHRFIFLTLTVRNPDITGLREELQSMNKAWRKLVQRKAFKNAVAGFIRTTEITRPDDPSKAHPHYHALLMVKPSYFTGRNYIKQADWLDMWRQCTGDHNITSVDVRTVKAKGKKGTENSPEALQASISETLKYAVKPSDLVTDSAWLLELTKQVHKLRFIASGGLLKDVLKEEAESTEDLINTGLEEETAEQETEDKLHFNWLPSGKHYSKYNPN